MERLLDNITVSFTRPPIKNKTYRHRMIDKIDSLVCPKCKSKMELVFIWHPKYGYLYDFIRDSKETVLDVLEKEENRALSVFNDINLAFL